MEGKILVISKNEKFLETMDEICFSLDYEAILRDSLDYLDSFVNNTNLSLILIFCPRIELEYLSFIDLIRRPSSIYNTIPIFAFSNLSNQMTLLESGADKVFAEGEHSDALVVAIKSALTRFDNLSHKSLNCYFHVSNLKHLVNILSFLGKQELTGLFYATSFRISIKISFIKGKIIPTEFEKLKGIDVLSELLSTVPCRIAVSESPIKDKIGTPISYLEKLPELVKKAEFYYKFTKKYDQFTTFVKTDKPFPSNANVSFKKIYRMVTIGMNIRKIFDSLAINSLSKVMLLHQLVGKGFILERKIAFEKHKEYLDNFYAEKKDNFSPVLTPIINALRDYNPQNDVQLHNFDYGKPHSVTSSSPTILLIGDDPKANRDAFNSIMLVSAELSGGKSKIDSSRSNEGKVKIDFGIDKYIDIHLIPPKIDDVFIEEMVKYKDDYFAVIFINSSTEEKIIYENRFFLHKMWSLFKCEYIIVGLGGGGGDANSFIVNCDICRHALNVDMSMEGCQGSCPVCDHEILVPNYLEYMIKLLKLSDDFPVTLADLNDRTHIRDILKLILSNYE